MDQRYISLMKEFASIQRCLPANQIDTAYSIFYRKGGQFNEQPSTAQLDLLENICQQGEERKRVGFKFFSFGTAIDRLVNKGLYGRAKQDGVSMNQIRQFRDKYFDEKTGEIDPDLKRIVNESGRKKGKRRGYSSRYRYSIGKERTQKQKDWIWNQYEKAYRLFELFLMYSPEFRKED